MIYDNKLFSVTYDFGDRYFEICDISDPFNITLLSNLAGYSVGDWVKVYDSFAYTGSGELNIFDISDPNNPFLTSTYPLSSSGGNCVDIYSDGINITAYIPAGYSDALEIIDVTDPYIPVLLGSYNTNYNTYSVTFDNFIAYVSNGRDGLKIIDVFNPSNPTLLATIIPNENTYINGKSLINGQQLIISDLYWNEILTYDISDPSSPVLINSFKWNLSSYDMMLYNDYLLTANYRHGFSILDYEDILPVFEENIILPNYGLYNYPNPFNPSTKISFSIKEKSKINLTIYNIKGQKIKTLINEHKEFGNYSISWDGNDDLGKSVSSGIYFYKMQVNNQSVAIKKCLILK